MTQNKKRQYGLALIVGILFVFILGVILQGCDNKSNNKPANIDNSIVTPDPISNTGYGHGTECINIVDDFFCYEDGKALRSGSDRENVILLSKKEMAYVENLKADIDMLTAKIEELKKKVE